MLLQLAQLPNLLIFLGFPHIFCYFEGQSIRRSIVKSIILTDILLPTKHVKQACNIIFS